MTPYLEYIKRMIRRVRGKPFLTGMETNFMGKRWEASPRYRAGTTEKGLVLIERLES